MLRNLVFAFVFIVNGFAAQATNVDLKELEAALETRIDHGSGVGYVVGIINGKERHILSVGKASLAEDRALNGDTLFEIGSITKTFTSLLLADMVLKGEVELDTSVQSLLPEGVKMPTRSGKEITLRHLATHSSGLPRLPSNLIATSLENPYANYKGEEMYAFLGMMTLTRDIGSEVEYSNLGMGLLGHVLALKLGQPYEEAIKDRILEPLGMSNTTITLTEDQKALLADGHDASKAKTSNWDLPSLAGAGAIRSSANDMMTYMAANIGLVETPLSEAIELSHKVQRDFAGRIKIGLGWITYEHAGEWMVHHSGGTGGYNAYVGFKKGKPSGVVVLGNSFSATDTTTIGGAVLTERVSQLVLDEKVEIEVAEADLQRLVGTYELAPNVNFTITVKDGNLFAQLTGQSAFQIYPTSKLEFFYKVVEASITFVEDENGKITSLILHQNGQDMPAKKIG